MTTASPGSKDSAIETLGNEAPAPWSPTARDTVANGKRAIEGLAESLAQRRLAEEIKRYVRGDVSGRAFLIAGHRGAGKTTAVLAAMQQVYNECQLSSDERLKKSRPLLVRLHAPSLLADQDSSPKKETVPADAKDPPANAAETPSATSVEGTSAKPEDGSENKSKSKKAPPEPQFERTIRYSTRFLQEMAAGIFPALVDELRRQLRGRGPDTARLRAYLTGERSLARDREMIAHLCDELSRGITLAELRELFRRLDLLGTGVLGNVDAFHELVAIQAASEAYWIVTGKFETELSSGTEASEKDEAKASRGFDGEKLVKALIPTSAAVAAAFGIATDHLAAGLVVAAGVLLSGWSASGSSTRARSRTAANSRSFKRDNSHESLVRRVPLLVEQLREAGFSPIFVLDELDKLKQPRPDELLEWLMRNLKSYVTERSFLCFVVERSYYERVFGARTGQSMPQKAPADLYGVEHTFYSDAAYVVPTHQALHRYLRTVLGESDDTLSPSQRFHLATFRHVLLQRSRVHVYDLHREIRRATESGELASLRANGETFRPPLSWTYAALLECGIEWVLSKARIRRRAQEDPYFAQVAYDLFYEEISDAWRASTVLDTARLSERLGETKIGVASDGAILGFAINELISYLRDPPSLLASVHEELDLDRLEFFFVSGEEPAREKDVNDALELTKTLKLHRRQPQRLAKCFASRRYRVLRSVTNRKLRPLLPEEGNEWSVDPQGYSQAETTLSDADLGRIRLLKTFKEQFELRFFNPGEFALLWKAASDPSVPWAQLESVHLDGPEVSDRDAIETVSRFADVAPDTCQLVTLLAAGEMALWQIRNRHSAPSYSLEENLDLLKHAIVGATLETRLTSAASLVQNLAQIHRVELSPTMKKVAGWAPDSGEDFLEWVLTSPDPAGLERELVLRGEDFAYVGTMNPDEALERARWLESLAGRMVASLEGRTSDDVVVEEGPTLDLLASAYDWFPLALAPVWSNFALPNEWPIKVCSELLGDAADAQPNATPAFLLAFAALRLGLRELAEDSLLAAQAAAPGKNAAALCAWIQPQLVQLPLDPRRILLLNPGPSMRAWLPLAGVAVRSVTTTDIASLQAANDLVFAEGEIPRPPSLLPRQFVLVRPAPPSRGTQSWQVLSDDTVVLLGPDSLAQALTWVAEAARQKTTASAE